METRVKASWICQPTTSVLSLSILLDLFLLLSPRAADWVLEAEFSFGFDFQVLDGFLLSYYQSDGKQGGSAQLAGAR